MTHFFSEYTRLIVIMLAGVLALYLFVTQIIGNQVAERLGLKNSLNDEIIYKTVETDDTYTFTVYNEEENCQGVEYDAHSGESDCVVHKSICIGDDFEPMNHVESTYQDGTDMSSFIVYSGAPENTDTPGVYDIEYYLKFEGSGEKATLELAVQDRSQNIECGAWDGEKACIFNSDCAPNQKCEAPDPEKPDEKFCVITSYVCEVNEDCIAGSTCILPEGATGTDCACNEGYCEYIGEIDEELIDDENNGDDENNDSDQENSETENQPEQNVELVNP